MVKHKRWSDKPKNATTEKIEDHLLEESIVQETHPKSLNLKSILQSGTKIVYIIAAAALLSGVFTPLTSCIDVENVVFGMLSIFLGLAGGIVIFLAIKKQKLTTIMVCAGLGMIFGSLILIHELAERSLFG